MHLAVKGHAMATGTVKWFNEQKGYGFIQPDQGGKDVFVHISAVERSGLPGLREGQKISYEVEAAREARAAEREAARVKAEEAERVARVERKEQDRAEAAARKEREAIAAAEQAQREAALEAERKAARVARYAARKARK